MSKTVTVTGAIVSQNGITLFFVDGTSKVLSQDNWKTGRIMEAIMTPLAKTGKAMVDLESFSIAKVIEEATGGEITVTDKGEIQTKDGEVIEGSENLSDYMTRIAMGDSAVGFKRFVKAFKSMKRKHSMKELLDFMKGNELPIADDGSIIVLKFLTPTNDGSFVDTHTRTVRQKVGSLVKMPVGKVDDNRRTLCSVGLHVCSYQYGSYGSAVFLAKVKPQDVISVPLNEGGKMRVSAYHLVAQVPSETYAAVGHRQSMISIPEYAEMVAKVVVGDHAGVLETVNVGGSVVVNNQSGKKTKIVTTPRKQPAKPKKPTRTKVKPVVNVQGKANKVTPAQVNAVISKEKARRDREYQKKLDRAERMLKAKKPKSLREIAKTLGIDRDAMTRNLRKRGIV